MRKLALLVLISLLLITSTIQARDKDTLTSLARYYADDTAVYVSVRTDDDFATVLNDLLNRLRLFFPNDMPAVTVEALLNTFSMQTTDDDFQTSFRPWLGDSAAFGLFLDADSLMSSMNDVPPIVLSVAITDREAAMAFFDQEFTAANGDGLEGYRLIEEGNFSVYLPDETSSTTFAVGDEVILIAPSVDVMPLGTLENPLSADASFNETVALLPNDSYNVLTFIDAGELNRFNMSLNSMMMRGTGTTQTSGLLAEIAQVDSTQAWGFTILDGDTLTIDLATHISDTSFYDEVGFELAPLPARDPAFTERIPADAVLFAQSSDFGPTTQMGLDNLRRFSAFIDDNGGLIGLMGIPRDMLNTDEIIAMESISLNSVIGMLNTGFAGMTGLSLERDVLPVLNGDVAAYLRVLPVDDFTELPILPDFGLMFQTDNDEGAAMLVDALHQASIAYNADFSIEAYGEDGAALNMPLLQQAGINHPNLDLLFGAGNGVFTFGTRPAVETALGTEANLPSTPAYQAAQAYFLPNSGTLLYIDLAPIGQVMDELIAAGDIPATQEVVDIRTAISLIESATGTVTSVDAATSLARFTLTLSESPVVTGGES